MASPLQIELLKVLASVAWADEEVANAELNFIKHFVRRFELSAEEWAQVEMYLDEKVGLDEMKRVTKRFLARAGSRKGRAMLVEAVRQMLDGDGTFTEAERKWMHSLQELLAETGSKSFLLDGLKSLLRVGGMDDGLDGARELEFHDFLHNRVLFKLRRALGARRLEKEGSPEQIKKLTLCAALLGRIGYVDAEFGPEEEACVKKTLSESWNASPELAEAATRVAIDTVRGGLDLYRPVREAKAIVAVAERQRLVEAMFALAKAEGRMSHEETEEIRRVANGLELSHREFIEAKVKVLRELDR